MFGDLDWPMNASRGFVSDSWVSCSVYRSVFFSSRFGICCQLFKISRYRFALRQSATHADPKILTEDPCPRSCMPLAEASYPLFAQKKLRLGELSSLDASNPEELSLIIHAEHVVHRRGYCFHFGCIYVCMYVSALERNRLIGMTWNSEP